jgi:hypothetical protein
MLFRSKQAEATAAQEVEPQTQSEEQDGLVTFGDAIIPSGQHTINELPAEVQNLVSQIDFSDLAINEDYQAILAKMQQETLLNMATKGVDIKSIPTRKVTSISQLSPDEQKLLRTVLGQAKSEEDNKSQPGTEDNVMLFSSPEELFKHVGQQLAKANAANAVDATNTTETSAEPPRQATVLFAPKAAENTRQAQNAAVEPVASSSKPIPPSTMSRCPHCDLSLFLDPSEYTEGQKSNFIMSVVSGQPYTDTIELFGGNIQLTLKALSITEMDYLDAASTNIAEKSELSVKDRYDFYLRSFLAFSLTRLKTGSKVYEYPAIKCTAVIDDIINNVLERCEQLTSAITSADLFKLMCNEAAKFQYKHRRLVAMGLNSDFWKPIQR